MTDEMNMRFYELFEKLASATQIVNRKPDIPYIESVLNEISAMFRLSKGVTRFFHDPGDEKRDGGETMISYDLGLEENVPVHTVRFVTRFLSITTMTVYMSPDEPPLSEDDLAKVDLTMRTVLAFISRNRLQDIAEELAFFDDDGFRNIRSFFRYMMWKGQPGGLDKLVSLNYNLRHFSLVNEQFGREGGDKVLHNHYEQVVKLVGSEGLVSRLGGDSFVCFCEKDSLPELLSFLTEAAVPYDDQGNTVMVRCFAGVFVIPEGYAVHSPNDIMGKIIQAYVFARNGDQGQIVYYNDKLVADRERVKHVQQQFPEALKNGEFHVFYQPKVNTVTGEICGGEALCRWFRNGKIIPPMEFIPVLEETSDICKLDFYVLEQVCRNIRKWLDEGRKAVRISVNLSRRHMLNDNLLERIIGIIERYNVPHKYIEIELTETTTDVEFRDLQRVVSGLQQQNIYTSVDDFGMGYSSLNLIRVIPWNVLKVDRSFLPLDNEENSSIRSIMFRHVVAMTKEMGLECIVEGVETRAQLNILKENHCEQAQGFLFDKPLPLEEFEKRLDMKSYSI